MGDLSVPEGEGEVITFGRDDLPSLKEILSRPLESIKVNFLVLDSTANVHFI